ncbi:MAG: PKD domain-containing protein [Flavobacteriales bacterium]
MRGIITSFILALFALVAHGQAQWSVEPLNIKPAGDDFAPVLVDSTLYFTSIRDRVQVVSYTDAATNKPLADLYSVDVRNARPGHVRMLDGALSTPLNDGPASFSPSGDTICITRNIPTGKGNRKGELLGLYFAVRTGNTWSEVTSFAHNSDSWSVMHGSFSTDGRTLYLASDQPGGLGGTDLYVSRKTGESWSAPQNMGPEVNSQQNELFPNAGNGGSLVFGSDRAGGLGKLDLYTTEEVDGDFSIPLRFPAPINSVGNDIGWALNADGVSGFLSSDRDGKGAIYTFAQKAVAFQDCAEQKPTKLCYAFEDQGSFNTDTLPLRYEWDFGDGQRQAGLNATHCYAKPGTYGVKLNIVDTLTQGVYFNETGYDLEAVADVQAVIGGPDTVATGADFSLNARDSNLPGFTPKETHWDLGDGLLANKDSVQHMYAEAGTYRIRLDLIGGPNGNGGFVHHCVFRNVQAVNGYVEPAIKTPVLAIAKPKADGYRFNYSELPNDFTEAALADAKDVLYSVELFTSATRVGLDDVRFLSVRKNYAVTERFLTQTRLYSYSIGTGKTPLAVFDAYAFATKNGFAESTVKIVPKEKPLTVEQVADLPLEALNNTIVRVSAVRFKSGEHRYDQQFNAVLDKIVAVVAKHPEVELVIEAHTDNVGREKDNMALSQERAQGVVAYFVAHGIAPARLRPIGFGEDRPVVDNSTEEGRAANRRVEFRLNISDGQTTARP